MVTNGFDRARRLLHGFCGTLTAFALVAATFSCTEEADSKPDEAVFTVGETAPVTVSAEFGETIPGADAFAPAAGQTRTTLEGLSPVWVDGDRISLFGESGSNGEMELVRKEGGKAVFHGTADARGPYTAVYPFREDNALKDGLIYTEIPVKQTLDGSSVAPGAMVAVAKGTETAEGVQLRFRNACGLLKVIVKGAGITAIRVQTLDGSPLAGRVGVDPADGTVRAVENGSDQVTLYPAGTAFEAGTYYIAAIPGSKEGLRLAVSRTSDARKGAKESDSVLELARSSAVSLGDVPQDGMEWAYLIGDYADLKAWRDDKAHWAAGGETVTFTGDVDMQDEPWEALTDSYPGVIEGNGHRISHIRIETATLPNAGFFGKNWSKEVRNLVFGSEDGEHYDGTSCIRSAYTTDADNWIYAGIITVAAADVRGVTSFVPVTVLASAGKKSRSGGICAWVAEGRVTFENCRNYGAVTLENNTGEDSNVTAGGILGGMTASSVTLRGCENHGTVLSRNIYTKALGGIVGLDYSATTELRIEDCTNTGDIRLEYSATQNDFFAIGGIIGRAICKAGATPVRIAGCVNRGAVFSEAVHQHFAGGIAGRTEGALVSGCRNEGPVTIDHTAHASTRFQIAGGIVGAALSGYGENTLTDCTNTGEVSVKAASSGHTATPSSKTTFYGTNAGGILGLADGISALTGNRNEGAVSVENAFSASKAAYPAISQAGGILGYDFGTVGLFSDNVSAGAVSARTATATSIVSEAYAGGVIGRSRAAALTSGTGIGSVRAETADAAGARYAGSVAGFNGGEILACAYGGTVAGRPADATNIVGGGNVPLSATEAGEGSGEGGGVFSVAETEIRFPASGYALKGLRVTTGAEAVRITAEGLDWNAYPFPAEIPANQAVTLALMPGSGNVSDTRSGRLVFREAVSGTEKTVAVNQDNLYNPVDGFPARWEITSQVTYADGTAANAAGKRWIREGVAPTVRADTPTWPGTEPGTGYISAGSTTGNSLVYSIDASSSTKTLCVGNMAEGDYILFSVPVVSLPAGTDIDFMLTLNANTNNSPKYWLFEYWDGSAWKTDESRLYTASEDGKTRYSFWLYHFSSANHRTYIASFTLPQAVRNDFVKMRVRAVGPYNSAGGALKATPSAYVYFPATTYHACEIAAYPDAPAVRDRTRLMQLGNSFTYYYASAFKLKQICRAEGHQTDVRINVKGSQEFEHHLDQLPFSQEVIAEGGYDKAIIQDGSYFHAEYAAGADAIQGVTVKYTPEQILALNKRMTAAIKATSPGADVILESVWSYSRKAAGDNYLGFGSFEAFDQANWQGSTALAAADPNVNWLSPIGKAFALARSGYGFDAGCNWLNYTDNYHPNRYGAYLKACVNYLILFGEPFGAHPADCDVPAAEAARLRAAAEAIVLGSGRETFHVR